MNLSRTLSKVLIKQRHHILFGICISVLQVSFAQQISIDNSISPQQLIENHLVQGCVEVSNISSNSNGSINGLTSYGFFERASSNFPFENGILLSTGNASASGNTTNTNPLNDGETNWGTDSDLETALGISNTLNATSIEFDFVSVSNQIQFNYILASEEYYANYPCEYSDGFAFLIKPAGSPAPYTNVAIIPNTSIPVNTNTIHDDIVGFCPAENQQYFEGYNLGDTNFNGRTTVLTASAVIQPNVQYHIKLVIADQNDENFDSAVFIEGNNFSSTVSLGPDITTCAESVTLDADTENPLATYSWYNNATLISGETSSSLSVSVSGNYTVEVSIPINNTTCVIQDDVVITLNSEQSAGNITAFEVCDDISNNGIETFDLSIKDSEVLASVPTSNYNISYHLSSQNAQNNSNEITAPIQNGSSPQTIYVRIEDIDNGCLAYTVFNLIVNPLPTVFDPTPLEVCDNSFDDGFTDVDLTIKDNEITGGNTNYIVNYHYSQSDADDVINPIPTEHLVSGTNQQLFVSIVDINSGCLSTTSLLINVLDNPNINTENQFLNACEADSDGFETFDLSLVIDDVLQGLTNVTTTFHITNEDAQTGDSPIIDIQNYANVESGLQLIYIRVVDDNTGCVSISILELHANILQSGTTIRDFYRCDDESNDGIAQFSLPNIASTIINGLNNVTVTFYETELDQTNDENAVDQSVLYTVNDDPHELFATIVSPDCIYYTTINLIIHPATIIQNLEPVDFCDTDDDGFTSIELDTFNDYVGEGIESPSVSYFLTEDDALNNENALPPFYTNTNNPETLYVRVENGLTGCSDYESIEINVIPAPTVTQPTNIIICDNDQDGYSIINLDNTISEIVSDTTDLTISFHTSEDDANSDSNAIGSSSSYNANTQTMYTRVESDITGCFALVIFEIIVNTVPEFIAITNFRHCETDGNQTADFIFNEKDSEILNGQTGKQVLYFETENDAINSTNVIDKNNAYQNNTSPQTIYVRVENLSDPSCYGTSSFIIEVGSIPVFDAPLDWFVCDDMSNDGQDVFDLSIKIDEMSANSSEDLDIVFYASFEDAENQENEIPLEYTNTINPQQIYARIENGTYCHAIAEFGLNIIQVPLVNLASEMEQCDIDYDGSMPFDLTVSEIEVLDIRQDDILVTYHETIEDVEAHSNVIQNPDNYNNIANPQTVFIKITNTISNCYVTIPLDLIVNLPPSINSAPGIEICDNDEDSYDLSESIETLIGDQENVNLTFYSNANDAANAQNEIPNTYTYTTQNDTIYARAENTITNCFAISSFVLRVNSSPSANSVSNLEACDDDYDAMIYFDLSQQTSIVLGNQNANLYTITYFELEEEAITDENAIEDLNYNAFDEQTIYVRIENNNTGCFNTTSFSTIIHRKPIVEIPDQTICLDNLPLLVSANTNVPNDTYSWSTNETTPEIEITEIGVYGVTVTSEFGCVTTTTFNVIESEIATIEFTETVDFSDPNNITVSISGIGNYLYTLDNGAPQESNFFDNVSLGPHTITVIDLNGCASAIKEVVIMDAPLFFTPNSDGYFDTWHITGVNQLEGTVVYIFDRFGKLIKTLSHTSQGWDGTYRGKTMPSDDYWFLANVEKDGEKFDVKGHFTLKR